MKKLLLRRAILVANSSLLAMGMMACGGNKNNNNTNAVDAGGGSDTGSDIDAPVGPTCTTTAIGAQGIDPQADPGDGSIIIWDAPVTTDLGAGAGSTTQLSIQFYSVPSPPSLTAPIDLSAGIQANFSSCSACLRVDESDSTGTITKTFYQTGGTLSLSVDPLVARQLMGTVTDLAMTEVTIDPQTFESTVVPGGVCLSLGTITLAADNVPLAWTCAKAAFNDGTNCDCSCGAHDPDCDIDAAPVVGCTGTQVCAADVCTDTCNVLVGPVGCPTAGTCGYENDTTDICYLDPTLVDPALIGAACASASPLFCNAVNTVALGVCDQFVVADSICRKACDANTDCGGATPVCTPIPGLTVKGFCTPPPPANDKCQGAIAITIGTPVDGNSVLATSNYDAGLETATCDGLGQPGPDLAYKVTLTAGQAITATLTNVGPNFDPSLSILGPGAAGAICDANPVNCLTGADANINGAGETLPFTATTAGTYFIIVDSFSSPGGAFTLTVTSP